MWEVCTQPMLRWRSSMRGIYTRREEGVSLWVVKSSDIVASDPRDSDALFTPAADKIYRHPTFYDIPKEVETL